MPLPGLKLIMAASSGCLVRTVTTTTSSGSRSPLFATPKPLRTNRHVISAFPLHNSNNNKRGGWRIAPCAYTPHSAHDNRAFSYPFINLGFLFSPRHDSWPSSSHARVLNSSSEGKPGLSDSDSGYHNMGSENNGTHCPPNHLLRGNQSTSPSMQQSSKILTLPTILTLGRVAAVPLLVFTFYADGWWGTTVTTSIFIAAAITDWLDGYIARRMKLKSTFGAFLDPVADKLMVAATLVLLCTRPLEADAFGNVPWLLAVPSIGMIGREITMSAVREWAAAQNSKLLEAVAVNNLGKWKTATQMTALTILLATRDSSPGFLVGSGVVLLYVSAGLAMWSLLVYMRKIWSVLLK